MAEPQWVWPSRNYRTLFGPEHVWSFLVRNRPNKFWQGQHIQKLIGETSKTLQKMRSPIDKLFHNTRRLTHKKSSTQGGSFWQQSTPLRRASPLDLALRALATPIFNAFHAFHAFHAMPFTLVTPSTPRHDATPGEPDRSCVDFGGQLGCPNPSKSIKNRCQDAFPC